VSAEDFRPDAIPAYLRFNLRIIGDRGQVLAEGRDVAALLAQHRARATEVLRRAAPPAEWERQGLTRWDFGELPRFVVRSVMGTELRSYPALVDAKTSVAIELFETEAAAAAAHREGVRRLLGLSVKSQLAALGKRAPLPFLRRPGLPPPRVEVDAFREQLLQRLVIEAFELGDVTSLPRTKAEFDGWLARGTPRLTPVFDAAVRAIAAVTAELDKTLRALDSASKQPSGSSVTADVKAQLEQLFPPDILTHTSIGRLEQFPRYLRAAQARLVRAVNDPRKDAAKAEPFTPLWRAYLAKGAAARDEHAARQLLYSLEELRIALFAPELKPAPGVTAASVAAALAELR
jgi:ATP-dependent helicase HrpA